MTINYTTLLGLAEPVTGTESGTWGDDVNKGITDYLDIAVAGTQTISGTQTAVTLSITNGSSAGNNISQAGAGATGSSQYAIINCTGSPASLLTITAPASSKSYIVLNATSTSQSVKIVGVGPTTGVTIASGEKAVVAWNGSDFVKVATTVITNLTGTLPVTNGGTGATTLTGLVKGNGTSAFTAATAGTDYAAAPTGTNTQLLANNGSGGFTNVTVAGSLTYSGGTLTGTGITTGKSIAMAMIFGG